MKVLDTGYSYRIQELEGDGEQTIIFKKTKEINGELQPVHSGVSNEEVIKVLIDRLLYLNEWMYDSFNSEALIHLTNALNALNARQADRKIRGVLGTKQV